MSEKTQEKVEKEGDFKIKKKPKKLTSKKQNTTKVDFKKQEEEAIEEKTKNTEDAVRRETTSSVQSSGNGSEDSREDSRVGLSQSESVDNETSQEEVSKSNEEEKKEETPVIEEISIGEEKKEIEPQVAETPTLPKVELPENVEKLVDFMKETGGTMEDYIRLNADYSNIDNDTLIKEYYKHTKPHLDSEEINFILEDNFTYDEEVDEERYIKKKKLAYKEEIAKARNFLDDLKGKYYDEIKLRPGVTQEQKKATEFFNRYNNEQEVVKQRHEVFKNNTKDFFDNEFKGFEFKLGEKNFRYNVNNTSNVADNQSDLTNLVGKFLDDKGNVKDFNGYHKAIYAAQNVDTIASHFYEQGKADATKNIMAKSKNISNEPRQTATGDVFINGLKVRSISGVDSSRLKIKTKK